MKNYFKLRHMKCPLPWISSSFKLLDKPVLVMEKLLSLGEDDDEFQMAIDVIDQLRYLHQFAVHNDIKPGKYHEKVCQWRGCISSD